MKSAILIATSNLHKKRKLVEIVSGFFRPVFLDLPKIKERGKDFREIAENKAKKYSEIFGGWTVATDAGARIPALKNWNALKTQRFMRGDDFKRMDALLKMMKNKKNRDVFWDEAIAVANNGKLFFSAIASTIPAKLQKNYNPKKYEPGHWLDSLCSFPQFGNKNFFDLTLIQKLKAEDSWVKLKKEFTKFFMNPKKQKTH